MKHYRPILAAAILSAAIGFHTNDSYAQNYGYPEGKNAADLIREDTLRTGNNHHIYEYVDLHDTRAPKGYKAFYISHYGRHGSRTDHRGNEAWVVLEKELRPAYEAGILSWKGRQAYEKIVEMCEVGDGMREMLTPVGVKEHKEIARRMYRRFREVFRQSKEVEARSSTVQRCVLSMGAFCTALAAEDPKLDIDLLTGQRYMDYIAHTTGYGEATAGSEKMLKAYKKAHPRDTVSFFALMFNDPAEGRAFIKDAYHFESNLIECANYCQCLGVEDVFHRCMPFEVYYDAWSLKNRSLYLVHCNSAEFGDKRIPIGKPLVDDIIAKADAAVAGNGRAADLRFGHDYPLMALTGYLDLQGVGGRYSFDEIDDKWFGSWNICMASNLQLVFYRNRSGDVLVKCLYNERETLINGLEPFYGPYYRWDELRKYWMERF